MTLLPFVMLAVILIALATIAEYFGGEGDDW